MLFSRFQPGVTPTPPSAAGGALLLQDKLAGKLALAVAYKPDLCFAATLFNPHFPRLLCLQFLLLRRYALCLLLLPPPYRWPVGYRSLECTSSFSTTAAAQGDWTAAELLLLARRDLSKITRAQLFYIRCIRLIYSVNIFN